MTNHGTYSRYKSGCRCDECKEYNRARIARGRADRLAAGRISHGTRSGYDAGCRCEKCRQARTAAYESERSERRIRRVRSVQALADAEQKLARVLRMADAWESLGPTLDTGAVVETLRRTILGPPT